MHNMCARELYHWTLPSSLTPHSLSPPHSVLEPFTFCSVAVSFDRDLMRLFMLPFNRLGTVGLRKRRSETVDGYHEAVDSAEY
jgi:hypothetical protein